MKINIIKLLQPRAVSNCEIRRWVSQGAVSLNGIAITGIEQVVDIKLGDKIQIGKHQEFEITKEYFTLN